MKVNVRLSNPALAARDDLFARAVRILCEAAVLSNRIYIREHKPPALYQSGVVYQNEPLGPPDELLDIPAILAKKWGDCMHLCCWRVAELRERGEKARIAFVWRRYPASSKNPNLRLFHVIVRRGDGKLEDPSRKLGM